MFGRCLRRLENRLREIIAVLPALLRIFLLVMGVQIPFGIFQMALSDLVNAGICAHEDAMTRTLYPNELRVAAAR